MPQFTSPRARPAHALRKPRNPLVAPALHRQAGRHQAPHPRQAAQSQLRQALREWHPPTPHD
jgi:hypothetical protein